MSAQSKEPILDPCTTLDVNTYSFR